MAAPTFVANGDLKFNTSAATPVWPAHQADDIGLLWVQSANQTISLSSAQGFAEVVQVGTGTGGAAGATRLALFWCRATSGAMPAPVVADAGDHVLARIMVIRGCVTTGNPWDVFTSDVQAGADTGAEIPGTTTTVTDCLVLAGVANATETGTDQTSGFTNANLTGIAERMDNNHAGGVGGGFGVGSGIKAAIGAYGTTTATLATASAQARISIAMKAAGDVAGDIPVFQAAGTAVTVAGSTLSPAWPAHLEGDVALLIISTGNQTITLSDAQGFVEVADSPQSIGTANNAESVRLAVYWCRATSAAMAAPTISVTSGNHINAQILTFRGCIASGNPWDVTAGDTEGENATVTIPGDTTTVVNCLVVAIAADTRDTVSTAQYSSWANASLSDVTEIADYHSGSGHGTGFGAACGGKAAIGAYSATTAALPSSIDASQARISIALKPPASGGGGGGGGGGGQVGSDLPHRYWRLRLLNTPGAGPNVNEVELVERNGTVAGAASLITAPSQVHPGITHIRPAFLVNQGADATAELDIDVAFMTVPAGYVPSIPTDQVTRVVETFADDDGVLMPTVGQSDGASVLPLVKGLVRGSGRHGDEVVFSSSGRVFQGVPLVRFWGGITSQLASKWGTAAEVDAGTASTAPTAATPQYEDFSAQDLTESGFTLVARLRQKATITLRSLNFAGTELAVDGTDTISTLTNAPSTDGVYWVDVAAQAQFRSKNGSVVRLRIRADVETSINSGATWQKRASMVFEFETSSLTLVTLTSGNTYGLVVAGLTADGTDRVRIRRIADEGEGLGALVAAECWVKGITLRFATSSGDKFASKTPDTDDLVSWEAVGNV